MRLIVTGGAGFIGSALIRHIIANTGHHVLNIDKLTYAGSLSSLESVGGDPRYQFMRADICDRQAMRTAFTTFQPDAVIHLAAESHVDRSIDDPFPFLQTNIIGTATLLTAATKYRDTLPTQIRDHFKFHHVSTDEVFGSLESSGAFTETTAYNPSSPYSASKAGADHLVRAWARTYGLPVLITNSSNNYGPYQFPEKLIPLCISRALEEKPLPLYGDGQQIRDWIYVEDHAIALLSVLESGKTGETYNIGGNTEISNLDLIRKLCEILDLRTPRRKGAHADLLSFVNDRPGHDRRYAIDSGKIERDLGWRPKTGLENGLALTVDWYLSHQAWIKQARHGAH